MIAHIAAKYYLEQPNRYSVVDMREAFEGEIVIEGGKPLIVFPDKSSLSIRKLVRVKFLGEEMYSIQR